MISKTLTIYNTYKVGKMSYNIYKSVKFIPLKIYIIYYIWQKVKMLI